MGAAMMEPDVRMETNALGFCHRHFRDLLAQSNRLSLGLMLNTYLGTVQDGIFAKKGIFDSIAKRDKRTERSERIQETCFVCSKTNWGMEHMVKTFFVMFRDDPKFQPMFRSQEFICMPHYAWIRGKAPDALKQSKQDLTRFLNTLDELVGEYVKSLNSDVNEFCDSFDYRNAGKLHSPEMEHVRTSPQKAVQFLTGRNVL
jgi:hypothetical protein